MFIDDNKLVGKKVLPFRVCEYFKVIMNHCGDTIYAWDVGNEMVDDKSGKILRKSSWLDVLDENYIYIAFVLAHEFQTKVQLFYNDYNEINSEKRDKIYSMLQYLINKGAPIHGMAMQGHWNIYGPSIDEIQRAIEKYASLGFRIQITELDLSIYAPEDKRTD